MSADKKAEKPAEKKGKPRFPRNFSIVFSVLFLILYWPGLTGLDIDTGVFGHAEDVWTDRLFVLRKEVLPPADPKILLVALDAETGGKYGFPVPRPVLAQLTDKLKAFGVKTLVFDVMFFEPREGDRALAAATKRFKRVIHLFVFEGKLAVDSEGNEHGEVMSVTEPIGALKATAQYLGHPNIQAVLDSDGHIRRSQFVDSRVIDPKTGKGPALSMDLVAVASYLDKPVEELIERFTHEGGGVIEHRINFRRPKDWLQHAYADEASSTTVMNLATISAPYQTISALDVLAGHLTATQKADLKNSIVIVGSTALGYFDHYPTPFVASAPGPELHCNNMDNILHDDFLRNTPRMYILLMLLVMIWLPLLLLRFSPAVGNLAVVGVLGGWFAFTYWKFGQGVRIDFIAPALALVSSFLVQTVHRVLTEGAEKKFIKQTFGQFVSPDIVEKLVQDPSLVKLGGEKREMTVFFLDIAHFTTISEKMSPEGLIIFLNRYLSALSHVIQERKGTVDKYIGDCIMAFWNAPLDDADHHANACLAAIECQQVMAKLNENLDPNLPEMPAIRIGLNSGDMTVGLTGSEKKLAYTVIGDEVNLASRLEGANKFFGSHIMISEACYKGAESVIEARELGRVRVVGKAIPIRVYELLAKKGELSAQWRQAKPLYEKGLVLFNKADYEQAVTVFQEVLKLLPDDGPATLYLNTSKDYAAIPPDDKEIVFNLTAK
ncbi:MAG: CHASE2 domain-containing protein [Elusimicrobiota bacterium]